MKSRTSFCNKAVLKKDITRFFPVWGIYLICGLLASSTMVGNYIGSVAINLRGILSYGMPWISCGYALVVALLLFGDLYNSRLCNALHAMPLRRESWFCTHYIAGILMALVPELLISLVLMPMLGKLWYVSLIWLGGSMLMYLFFFGLACLCCMATGNRFAAILLYGLANFFSMELYWLFSQLILPFLTGVRAQTSFLFYLCPAIHLMDSLYFSIDTLWPAFSDKDGYGVAEGIVYNNYDYLPTYTFGGFEDGWIYLFILAAIGIGLTVAALLLYRRRQLECAGDFAAFSPVKWIISIFGSLACGMVFRLFSWDNEALGYVFLFVGIFVGFFLLEMLLQRKVKVFTKASFIKCTALLLCCALILIAGAVDLFGTKRYVPDEKQVASVLISPYRLSDDRLRNYNAVVDDEDDIITLTDPDDIALVLDIHRLAMEEHLEGNINGGSSYITIRYTLKSGRTVARTYRVSTSSSAYQKLKPLLQRQEYIFCGSTAQQIKDGLDYCYFDGEYLSKTTARQLVDYLYRDAAKGLIQRSDWNVKADLYWENCGYVELSWRPDGLKWRSVTLFLSSDSESLAFLRTHVSEARSCFGVDDLQELVDNLQEVSLHTPGLNDNKSYVLAADDALSLSKCLWLDVQDGTLSPTDTFTTDCIYIEVNVYTGKNITVRHFEVNSQAANTWYFLHEYLLRQDLSELYERMMEHG